MADEAISRSLLRHLQGSDFPLRQLTAVREARRYLDLIEARALPAAVALGASAEDIAEALGITRQGAYYRLKRLRESHGIEQRSVAGGNGGKAAGPRIVPMRESGAGRSRRRGA